MDNKGLIEALATRLEVSKKDVTAMLTEFGAAMCDAAERGDIVAIPAFGSFEPKKRDERVMVMPGTGRRMLIPPKISMTFRCSALLKQKLRGGKPGEEQS